MTNQPKQKNPKRLISTIMVIILVVAVIGVTTHQLLTQQPKQSTTQTAAMHIDLIGADGQPLSLAESDLLALRAYNAPGGFRKSNGGIAGIGNYTGILVIDLLDLVGGMNAEQTLTISATDGYTMSYSYNQVVNGQEFITFDPTTGSQTTPSQTLNMVLIYAFNGKALPDGEGPLRLGILGDEGLLSTGNLWIKMVTQLQITSPSTPAGASTVAPSKSPTTPTATPPTANVAPTSSPSAPLSSPNPSPTSSLPVPDFRLSVVAANGTKITLSSNDVAKMVSITYNGGSKKSNDEIVNVGTYTGVSLSEVCSRVGFSSGNTVTVRAADGYTATYSYDQVVNGGGFSTYDAQGNPVVATQRLYLILAYGFNGAGLDLNSGPLKTMIVGADGLITSGNLATRMVVEVSIT